MKIPESEKIDALNIGLMTLAGLLAIVIPFELFLFSYAILGPPALSYRNLLAARPAII